MHWHGKHSLYTTLEKKILLQNSMHKINHFVGENIHRKKSKRTYIKILRICEDSEITSNSFFCIPEFSKDLHWILIIFIVFLKRFFKKENSSQSNFASHFLYYFTSIISKGNGTSFTTEDSQFSFNIREAVFPVAFKNSKKIYWVTSMCRVFSHVLLKVKH